MFELSDVASTIASMRAIQETVVRLDERQDELTRSTAQYGVNLVRDRVQLEGRNADGEIMLTSSAKQLGRYSESHGRTRQQEGLRTDLINLTFSGELLNGNSWTVLGEGNGEYGAGFRENALSERAGYMEDLFGDIFQLSADEEQAAIDYFESSIQDLVTATF